MGNKVNQWWTFRAKVIGPPQYVPCHYYPDIDSPVATLIESELRIVVLDLLGPLTLTLGHALAEKLQGVIDVGSELLLEVYTLAGIREIVHVIDANVIGPGIE